MSGEQSPEDRFTTPTRAPSLPFDVLRARFTTWLRSRFDAPDLEIADLRSPGAAGVNNETLLLTIESGEQKLKEMTGLVVRLDAPTTLFPGYDIRSSFRCYEQLQDEPSVPTPRVYGIETDTSVLGRRFYVMERIDGLIPADNPTYHQSGWLKDLPVPQRTELFDNAIRVMARLHQVPIEGFDFLREMGIATPHQQMDYWRRYLDESLMDRPRDPLLEQTWDWLVANFPADVPEGFSWGDARLPNIIFQGVQCVGLLDWDMVSLAGAECDIAWWLVQDQAGSAHVGRLEGLHDPAKTVRVWEDEAGRKARNMEFWLMFNLFRLGGIMIRLKRFLGALGTPEEVIRDIDRINTAQSVLASRWGGRETPGLGSWDYLASAIGS